MNNQLLFELREAFTRGYSLGVAETPIIKAFDEFARLFGIITVCPGCGNNLTKYNNLCTDCLDYYPKFELDKQQCKHEFDGIDHCKNCGILLPKDYMSIEDLIEKTHPI